MASESNGQQEASAGDLLGWGPVLWPLVAVLAIAFLSIALPTAAVLYVGMVLTLAILVPVLSPLVWPRVSHLKGLALGFAAINCVTIGFGNLYAALLVGEDAWSHFRVSEGSNPRAALVRRIAVAFAGERVRYLDRHVDESLAEDVRPSVEAGLAYALSAGRAGVGGFENLTDGQWQLLAEELARFARASLEMTGEVHNDSFVPSAFDRPEDIVRTVIYNTAGCQSEAGCLPAGFFRDLSAGILNLPSDGLMEAPFEYDSARLNEAEYVLCQIAQEQLYRDADSRELLFTAYFFSAMNMMTAGYADMVPFGYIARVAVSLQFLLYIVVVVLVIPIGLERPRD